MRVTYVDRSSDETVGGLFVADLGVHDTRREPAAALATIEPPVRLAYSYTEEIRENWLEVLDEGERVVTVVELLSPSNKAGADRGDYLSKRKRLMRSDSHFVEIDLLRGGRRPPLPNLPSCAYYAMVRVVGDERGPGAWPIGLRERLPTIPIPLLDPDPAVPLDLQAILDECYDESGYEGLIYTRAPIPPLSPEDAAWAESLIPAGARGA